MKMDSFKRHLFFILFCIGYCLAFWSPLKNLLHFGLTRDYGSHVFFVIPTSIFLVYLKRREVFSDVRSAPFLGSGMLVVAASLGLAISRIAQPGEILVSIQILLLIVFFWSAFLLCYGARAFRTAAFPLLFLLLLVPPPGLLVEKVISYLQHGSADVAFWLFKLVRVPVFREGVMFHIPTLDLEVATECSGIRSSIVLLITYLLVSEFALSTFWKKLVLVLAVIPIVILKNGIRIVTISLLTVYVNRGFLHGWLHSSGGVVFYLLGLLALLPMLKFLRKGESRAASPRANHLVRTPV